ncbi:MAG: hypothetical protein KDC07_08650 [Chitinophagaceae bacterium]|nr:hypothetical protein [Chitinophagaceae bacterium]
MRGRLIAISILGVLLSCSAEAQTAAPKDTVIKGATIEIIQSYKPEVTRAPRPEPAPSLPPVDTTTPRLQYNVPQQTLFYSYGSLPLRPLALEITKEEPGFDSYVKLGGGNRSTLLLDAGSSYLKGDNYETAFRLHHLSQSGSIVNQKVSLTGLEADGTYHNNGRAFNAQLGISNNVYHYYGYDHNIYTYNEASVKQGFTLIDLGVNMVDEQAETKKLSFSPKVGFYSFSDKFNASEITVRANVPVTYDIDSNLQLYVAANITVTNLKNTATGGASNNIYQLAPGIRFKQGIFTGHAGISPTSGEANITTGKSNYLLPDVEVNFNLPGTQFRMNAGWQGNLVQNSYRQMATLNPYMSNAYVPAQTHTTEIFGGIKSNIGEHVTFNGRVSWWQYNNMPLFINDTASDKKQFLAIYDPKVNALGLQAAIRYQVAQTFSIGFNAQWMNFYNKTYTQLWHRPGVTFTGDVQAQPMKKLTINAYISFIDELYALDNNNRTLKLNSILDMGAGAEYEIIDRLNIFVQANNLLNNRYQRWYGYNAYGFNIFGGARLKF